MKSSCVLLSLIFASATLHSATCRQSVGHVVSLKGEWYDQQRRLNVASDICSDSKIVRTKDLLDSDFLIVRAFSKGAPETRFDCAEGVTCKGALNLHRIPVDSGPLQDFVGFVKQKLPGAEEDQGRLRNLIHRGSRQLHEGVLLASAGRIDPVQLFSGPMPAFPILLEFCAVRPGQACTGTARPIEWTASGQTIPAQPGFFKVVLDEKYQDGYMRTAEYCYILIVGDEDYRKRLAARFEAAAAQAEASRDEDADPNLVRYLFYLSGGYGTIGAP